MTTRARHATARVAGSGGRGSERRVDQARREPGASQFGAAGRGVAIPRAHHLGGVVRVLRRSDVSLRFVDAPEVVVRRGVPGVVDEALLVCAHRLGVAALEVAGIPLVEESLLARQPWFGRADVRERHIVRAAGAWVR